MLHFGSVYNGENTAQESVDRAERARRVRNADGSTSDSLDLLGDHHRVVLAQLLALHGLVVEGAAVRRVVAVLTAVEASAAAREPCKNDRKAMSQKTGLSNLMLVLLVKTVCFALEITVRSKFT